MNCSPWDRHYIYASCHAMPYHAIHNYKFHTNVIQCPYGSLPRLFVATTIRLCRYILCRFVSFCIVSYLILSRRVASRRITDHIEDLDLVVERTDNGSSSEVKSRFRKSRRLLLPSNYYSLYVEGFYFILLDSFIRSYSVQYSTVRQTYMASIAI